MPCIDIVTRCMKRKSFLIRSMKSWVELKNIRNIIIVDWGCFEKLPELVKEFNDPRIKIISVKDQKFFDHCKSRNIGARFSKADYIFNLDAEIVVFNISSAQKFINSIFFGSSKVPIYHYQDRKQNCSFYGGVMLYTYDIFKSVNGFDERMYGWGYEDTDFVKRCTKIIPGVWVDFTDFLFHLPHDNISRNSNFFDKELKVKTFESERMNKLVSRSKSDRWIQKKFKCTITSVSKVKEVLL